MRVIAIIAGLTYNFILAAVYILLLGFAIYMSGAGAGNGGYRTSPIFWELVPLASFVLFGFAYLSFCRRSWTSIVVIAALICSIPVVIAGLAMGTESMSSMTILQFIFIPIVIECALIYVVYQQKRNT